MGAMTIVRRLARPLIAASFISGGIDTLRNPKPKVPAADKVVGDVPPKLPSFIKNTEDLVKVDAVAKIVGGLLLAFGKFPRPAALGLAASLIPTTLAGHRFSEGTDPTAARQTHFLKNASIVGGLLLAAVDAEGKPSLAWRGRHAAGQPARLGQRHLQLSQRLGARPAARQLTMGWLTVRWPTLARTAAAVITDGGIGSLATPDSTWYRRAGKPSFQPPGVVFPIVWTALYAKIAWASARTIDGLIDAGRPDEARAFEQALRHQSRAQRRVDVDLLPRPPAWAGDARCAVMAASSVDLARRAAKVDRLAAAGLAGTAGWTSFATVLYGTDARRSTAVERA